MTPVMDDDEALGWGEDADPTHIGARLPSTEPRVPAVPNGSAPAGAGGALLLVTLGIIAGVYLLYSVGWLLSAQHSDIDPIDPIDSVMAGLRLGLTVVAAPAWFVATHWLTRERKPLLRLLWLLLGGILLIPWPYLLGT